MFYFNFEHCCSGADPGGGLKGLQPPFEKFSNLSGSSCLSLFRAIDHYKKTVAILLLDSSKCKIDFLAKIATPALCLVPSIIANKAGSFMGKWKACCTGEYISFPKSLGNKLHKWKTLWQSTDRELPHNLLLSTWCLQWMCFARHPSPSGHHFHWWNRSRPALGQLRLKSDFLIS